MRIIVVSDSHGNVGCLRRAIMQAQGLGAIDIFVHLGDGLDDLEAVKPLLQGARVIAVRGNNDWRRADGAECTFMADGVRIYACHGNQWGVKYGMERLCFAAREREANVALYGHTHRSAVDFEYGIWFTNPGALCSPRAGGTAYAELLTDGRGSVTVSLRGWL